jgi:uncharacterized protein (TIGR00290 family)
MTGARAFFSWSGGKDSMLALHRALAGGFDVKSLLVMMDASGKHSHSHAISPDLLEAQSTSLGIPLTMARASWEDYENTFITCLKTLAHQDITHGIFGDIDLQPHRDWEEKVCAQASIQAYLPLWGKSRYHLTKEFMSLGYKAIVTCVNGNFLDASFTGRPFNAQFLKDLPPNVDACGENGEFHTFVTAGPRFKVPLSVQVEDIYSISVDSAPYHYARLALSES